MAGRWFKHGKWPKFFVRLHYYSMVSFVLLVASGLALYLPVVHAPLIPYIPYIYPFHILLGIVFTITIVVPFVKRLPQGKHIWRWDWWFPITLGTAIVLTGLVLWQITWFPSAWRNAGFRWHGDLSYVLGAWLILHAFVKAIGVRPDPDGWMGRVDPERRRFLRYIGVGAVGAAVLTVIDPFASIAAWWRNLGRETAGAGENTLQATGNPGFAAFYTVTGGYPTVALKDYTLRIDGQVRHPQTLTWDAVLKLPQTHEKVNFQCVTGWSVPNVTWTGVHLSQIVKRVKPHPDVKFVHFYSFDGQYTESLPLAEALDPLVLLAHRLNEAPLPTAQGAPLRLVVPNQYGYKSIKWVNRVEFATSPLVGYWEQRGYPSEAIIGHSRGFF